MLCESISIYYREKFDNDRTILKSLNFYCLQNVFFRTYSSTKFLKHIRKQTN